MVPSNDKVRSTRECSRPSRRPSSSGISSPCCSLNNDFVSSSRPSSPKRDNASSSGQSELVSSLHFHQESCIISEDGSNTFGPSLERKYSCRTVSALLCSGSDFDATRFKPSSPSGDASGTIRRLRRRSVTNICTRISSLLFIIGLEGHPKFES